MDEIIGYQPMVDEIKDLIIKPVSGFEINECRNDKLVLGNSINMTLLKSMRRSCCCENDIGIKGFSKVGKVRI